MLLRSVIFLRFVSAIKRERPFKLVARFAGKLFSTRRGVVKSVKMLKDVRFVLSQWRVFMSGVKRVDMVVILHISKIGSKITKYARLLVVVIPVRFLHFLIDADYTKSPFLFVQPWHQQYTCSCGYQDLWRYFDEGVVLRMVHRPFLGICPSTCAAWMSIKRCFFSLLYSKRRQTVQ